MRVALAQINTCLGDFEGNSEKIIESISRAKEHHCDLVVFPELALFGYPPGDLLERHSVVDKQVKVLEKLQKKIPDGIGVLFGAITKSTKKTGKPFRNSAVFITKKSKPKIFNKELLPAYDVFDETRHVQPGDLEKGIFKFKGKKFLVMICEDMWGWSLPHYPSLHASNPLKKISKNEVDIAINLSASPFNIGKTKLRRDMAQKTVRHLAAPLVYVNQIGAQDELIFDGDSFVMDKKGKVVSQSLRFEEDLNIFDFEKDLGGERVQSFSEIEEIRQALVLGIRDFSNKIGLKKVHFGSSGGIDSAVVAALAVDALGPQNVTQFSMPSMFNSQESFDLAKKLAENLGTEFFEINIEKSYEAVLAAFEGALGDAEFGIVNENMQSRLRGLFMMAYSNKENSLLLTTGNKSEYATGYATLYGDMCGGLAPIADLLKGQVYELARHYNVQSEVIPQRIIDRPPSAELAPDQKDEDSLPPYDELDKAVKNLVEESKKPRGSVESWLLGTLMKTEFKRWQAAPILRVSKHAFGRGRRLPIAHKGWA